MNITEILHFKNIIKFIEKYNNLTGNAIDLGCGSGCDTIYLIEHNWNVLSIASTNVENTIRNKLSYGKQDKFNLFTKYW